MTTLVLGPSLGTSADACWDACAALLRDEFDVVAWELPGHGADRGPAPEDLTVEDLAARVLEQVDGPFLYAGDSVGGEVGLELLLVAPDRLLGAVLCCTGAKIGDEAMWTERIAAVRASGTASLVTASAGRWFGPGFVEREPERASALLHALRDATDEGYLAVVHALAAYDVRDRLGEIEAPVVAVAGAHDPTCPPDTLREIAEGVRHGRLVVLDEVGHQAPAEAPDEVALIIRGLAKELAVGDGE
jgi:3-oxoadipate enol-lactonase / 4-carboxymuconolactone decarboxylase